MTKEAADLMSAECSMVDVRQLVCLQGSRLSGNVWFFSWRRDFSERLW
ncbi:hypothetical protein GBL_0232 [Geobacillus kaustophilus GBlys]|uniref:Uncharacterized protein n=4 Tax=Geobacillus TaxID=129337 RepID=Q5KWG8_GEOKA|nr:hypothetical protein T260_03505 [Geobacillus sp. MAS1]BAD76968.1 hypothetical protein GK2683 [Geobacillus kaustophilus HTA426]GAD12015.1 hypothetical protein GBL_0232 [Geobacillus kaustophilus GBlys]GAJ57934.1 hypothetical protein B23_1140 [Geobacillus thermoleovorans B23]